MFNKLKKTWYADDFSYFIRNFGVFTLIFSAMTLIILQVMHSSLYTSVDEKLQALSSSPQAVIQLALNRATEEVKDIQPATADANKAEIKPNVSSNTEVLLFDKDFNQLLLGNRFLGLDKIKLDKKELNHIRQIQVVNSYGQEETYRMILMETNSSSVSSNVKYAAVLINTSQLEQISQNHEHLIVVVMASFWLLSLIASVYLARVSVKPLLESMQKQKSFVENAKSRTENAFGRFTKSFRKSLSKTRGNDYGIQRKYPLPVLKKFATCASSRTNLLNLARRR